MRLPLIKSDYQIDHFKLTLEIFEMGYYQLSKIPYVESVSLIVENEMDVIYPQFVILEISDELHDIYPSVDIGSYIITWACSASSSSSLCGEYDPFFELVGSSNDILQNNIGCDIQVRYIVNRE